MTRHPNKKRKQYKNKKPFNHTNHTKNPWHSPQIKKNNALILMQKHQWMRLLNKCNHPIPLCFYPKGTLFILASNYFFTKTQTYRKGTDGYNSDEEVYNVAKYVNKLNRDKKEQENKLKAHNPTDLKYDDYGNIITPDKDRIIEILEPVNHSKIWYSKFRRNFYNQHSDITNMTELQVKELRVKHNIFVKGRNVLNPVSSFGYFGFDEKLMDVIISQGFESPTPIQMQSVPLLCAGFNVMGLAKTGSGKTAAFVWPLIAHILDQDDIECGYDGAIAMIISPTRELASQTYKECKRYVSPFGLRVAPLYGGLNMYEQRKMMKDGVEIIVATPGRLIDLIKVCEVVIHLKLIFFSDNVFFTRMRVQTVDELRM